MTLEEFRAMTHEDKPSKDLDQALKAMWYDAKNDWEEAHNIAQDMHTNEGSWIHAYLHRKEGDIFNARYWYNRAGKNEFKGSLEEEWDFIVGNLLDK